jgi:hypothetical protein
MVSPCHLIDKYFNVDVNKQQIEKGIFPDKIRTGPVGFPDLLLSLGGYGPVDEIGLL